MEKYKQKWDFHYSLQMVELFIKQTLLYLCNHKNEWNELMKKDKNELKYGTIFMLEFMKRNKSLHQRYLKIFGLISYLLNVNENKSKQNENEEINKLIEILQIHRMVF